jgi:hypothetical protein
MFDTPRRVVVTGLLIVSALAASNCSSRPDPPATATPSSASEEAGLTPVLSVQELMEKIIDPTADWIFDAAVVDVSMKGTVETKPVSDEDWLKVERGALLLAEASNLLKMPRHMVAPGTPAEAGTGGHLEYWYPGDRKAVLADPKSHVTYSEAGKK